MGEKEKGQSGILGKREAFLLLNFYTLTTDSFYLKASPLKCGTNCTFDTSLVYLSQSWPTVESPGRIEQSMNIYGASLLTNGRGLLIGCRDHIGIAGN